MGCCTALQVAQPQLVCFPLVPKFSLVTWFLPQLLSSAWPCRRVREKKRHVLEKKNCTEEKLWTCLWLQVANRADWGWEPGRDGGQGPSLSRGGGGGMYMSLYRTIRSNKAECSFWAVCRSFLLAQIKLLYFLPRKKYNKFEEKNWIHHLHCLHLSLIASTFVPLTVGLEADCVLPIFAAALRVECSNQIAVSL